MNRIKIILISLIFQFCFTTESIRYKDEAVENEPEATSNINLKTEETEEPVKTENDGSQDTNKIENTSVEIPEKISTEVKAEEPKPATETRSKYRKSK